MLRKILQKKAQSTMEMAMMLPVFLIIMLGAFDLALVQTSLIDTMSVARNTLRSMSLVAKDKSGRKPLCVAARSLNFLGRYTSAPFTQMPTIASVPNCSNNVSFGTGGNAEGGYYTYSAGNYNIGNGGGALNAPQLVQLCSKVKPIIPAIWGEKEISLCVSYFGFRQYQDY